jgi:hypothetical protein
VFTHCLAAGNLVGVALNYIFLLCHLSQACLTSNFNQCFYYSIVISLLSSPLPPSKSLLSSSPVPTLHAR